MDFIVRSITKKVSSNDNRSEKVTIQPDVSMPAPPVSFSFLAILALS
jgi:hypothetical protein